MRRIDGLRVFHELRTDEPVILGVGFQCYELYSLGHSDLNLYQVNLPYPTPTALGLALALPHQKVIAMEGDGSTLAGLSSFATVGEINPPNLVKIVWDNESWLGPGRHRDGHTGPMATATGGRTDLEAVAKAAGIEQSCTVRDEREFAAALERALNDDGPHCIVAKVDTTANAERTAIPYGLVENAVRFRRALIDKGWVSPWHAGVTALKEVGFDFGDDDRATPAELDEITSRLKASLPSEAPRPHLENARTMYEGLQSAGINMTVYLPDSGNYLLQRFAADDPKMMSISVTREDEGLAIAMGAFMGGKTPCLIMESSGVGLCYMALAWLGFQQRMAALLISSHSSGLGEHVDYHGVTRHVVDPLMAGMGIPHYMARDADEAALMFKEATMTVRGQILPVSIQLPRRILWED